MRLETPSRGVTACLAVALAVGVFYRLPPALFTTGGVAHSLIWLHPNPKWYELGLRGIDEGLHSSYVDQLGQVGLRRYPDMVGHWFWKQQQLPGAILPPTRFLYIYIAHLWQVVTHYESIECLRNMSSLFSMLTLGLATLIAWRMRGPRWAAAIATLMATAPMQLHMSQHALIDGFFAFWALLTLWLLWENLQAPRSWPWLAAYTLSFALLVLTKENAFFVWVGVVCVLVANRSVRFGTVAPQLIVATLLGPAIGVLILAVLAGGIDHLIMAYRLLVAKSYTLEYGIRTGDGPWQRYLIDLLLVSPIVLLLAIGCIFRLDRNSRAQWFFFIFLAGTYLLMCNVKNGMNLRYANMWDAPLRFLALSMLLALFEPAARRRNLFVALSVIAIATFEMTTYAKLFVSYPMLDPIPRDLMEALDISK